jgi:hypothetical protein
MKVKALADGTRIVCLDQVVVGKLTSPQEGVWECEWLVEFRKTPTDHMSNSAERAEVWATHEIADLLASQWLAFLRELAEGED